MFTIPTGHTETRTIFTLTVFVASAEQFDELKNLVRDFKDELNNNVGTLGHITSHYSIRHSNPNYRCKNHPRSVHEARNLDHKALSSSHLQTTEDRNCTFAFLGQIYHALSNPEGIARHLCQSDCSRFLSSPFYTHKYLPNRIHDHCKWDVDNQLFQRILS